MFIVLKMSLNSNLYWTMKYYFLSISSVLPNQQHMLCTFKPSDALHTHSVEFNSWKPLGFSSRFSLIEQAKCVAFQAQVCSRKASRPHRKKTLCPCKYSWWKFMQSILSKMFILFHHKAAVKTECLCNPYHSLCCFWIIWISHMISVSVQEAF